jgi:adenine-specific DNA-methyltransferase
MTIKSIKHGKEKRAHIPSREEAGVEEASPKVKGGPDKAAYPVNPVVHRGQDPELFWLEKYGRDDREDLLKVDIRSLYRHEHIAPETIIQRLYRLKEVPNSQLDINSLFGNALEMDEMEKVSEYYRHSDGWTNRLIQGDSLLVMTSLLEREGMAGKVQCIYFDPPYGIKYGSNWQMKLNNRTVKDGDDADLSGEPEQIKAYRDTWELGIHSYLSYLRDRLLTAKELLTESGSCFVQISDENVHLVRCIMDEVFGSENFCSLITFRKKLMPLGSEVTESVSDYILWYAKSRENLKTRPLFFEKDVEGDTIWSFADSSDGIRRKLTAEEIRNHKLLAPGTKVFRLVSMLPAQYRKNQDFQFELDGKIYSPPKQSCWKTDFPGMKQLAVKRRLVPSGASLSYILFHEDYPVSRLTNLWADTGGATDPQYVVQTNTQVIQRCILMTTDPGDLVLDPTCGSGTTAFVAEQWGRRWITIDTSRIALNIAKTRLMTATYPYYKLYDEAGEDIRQGFIYKKVPHITLKSIANDEPADEETLYDQPEADRKKLRVAGPFTVETLQNYEPVSPVELDRSVPDTDELETFEERIFEHLKSAGVKNGIRDEQAVFIRVDRLAHGSLHAEGFYNSARGERKAYLHIGPKYGTVSRQAVNEAVKECRARGDADWLIILGFSFESGIANENVTTSLGSFEVTKVRMHDDLMQDGLLKRDKKAASFVTIGEPDIRLISGVASDGDLPARAQRSEHGGEVAGDRTPRVKKTVRVEIRGLDIYDPVKDEVKARDVADIAYWMVDDDYDGSNFIVRQVFFCGGDKDEFDKWKKGLTNLAADGARKKAEKTLKLEIDDEAFSLLYGHTSHPIEIKKKGQKIAVRVISQFGEECTKVLEV